MRNSTRNGWEYYGEALNFGRDGRVQRRQSLLDGVLRQTGDGHDVELAREVLTMRLGGPDASPTIDTGPSLVR